jgi:hypothetical protein
MADFNSAIADLDAALAQQPQQATTGPATKNPLVAGALSDLESALASSESPQGPTQYMSAPQFETPDLFHGATNRAAKAMTFGLSESVNAAADATYGYLTGKGPWSDLYQKGLAQQRGEAENYAQAHPIANAVGATAGSLGAVAPGLGAGLTTATAPSIGGGLLRNMGTGAALGSATGAAGGLSDSNASDLAGTAYDAGVAALKGAGIGAAVPLVLGGGARMLNPQTNPDIQKLMDLGVRPTPGQVLGGMAGRAEEGLQSTPVIGDFIRNGRAGAIQDLNRGVINKEVLAPIGEELSPGTALGRDAISEAHAKVTAAYDKLVPQLTGKVDPQFTADIANLRSMAATGLPADRAAQFENILQNQVLNKISPNGTMTGDSFKEAESALGRLASNYRNSVDGDQRQLGGGIQEIQATLRNLLQRSNPARAAELSAVNNAYGNLLRVQTAAGRIGAEEGVFSPAQLLSSVRQLDNSLRKGAFARGDAKMQDIADTAKTVLGNHLPDSGTPYRYLLAGLGASALGHGTGLGAAIGPAGVLAPALAGAGMAAAYSTPGRATLAELLAGRPDWMRAGGDILRQAVPATSAETGYLAGARR